MRAWVSLAAGLLTGCISTGNVRDLPETPAPPPPTISAPADIQDPEALTLRDAVQLALAHNRDLRMQSMEPRLASTEIDRAEAAFDSELFGETAIGRERATETARSTGEQFGVAAESRASKLGLRKSLATGTQVELALRERRDVSNRAPEQQEVRAELDLTQPLLRGRSPTANWARVRQAELGVRVSVEELRGYVQALVSAIETTYWEYHLARKTAAITELALGVAEQQRDDVRTRIEVGDLARNEESAILAEVALRRQAVIEASAERTIRRLEFLSLVVPGRYDADPELLSPVDIPAAAITNVSDRVELALTRRPDLREAELLERQGRLDVVRTRNGLLPRLDFFAALAKTGFGNDFSRATGNLGDNTYEWTVGLRVLHELGRRERRADEAAALTRDEQASLALESLRLRIGTEVRQALADAERAREQIAASAETRRRQEATLQAERERFDVGASTALLIAQAQRDLLASQIGEQRARVQYRIALIALEVAEGSLLPRRGIDVAQP